MFVRKADERTYMRLSVSSHNDEKHRMIINFLCFLSLWDVIDFKLDYGSNSVLNSIGSS